MKFYVNNVLKHTFDPSYTSSTTFTNGRIVLGAAQATYNVDAIPNPLPAWKILHAQVMTSNTKYKNTNGTWVTVNSSNSDPKPDHTPKNRTTPTPEDYTVGKASFGSGIYYASLK